MEKDEKTSLRREACASWSRFETIGLELKSLEHLESQLLSFSGATEQLRLASEAQFAAESRLREVSQVRRFVRTLFQLLLHQVAHCETQLFS